MKPLIRWKLVERGGAFPDDALPIGHEANGAFLYACRAWFQGGLHLGKQVCPSLVAKFVTDRPGPAHIWSTRLQSPGAAQKIPLISLKFSAVPRTLRSCCSGEVILTESMPMLMAGNPSKEVESRTEHPCLSQRESTKGECTLRNCIESVLILQWCPSRQ